MQFINLQLQFDHQQLSLHIQTHESTQHFQLHGPVSDPEELAHQSALFIGIHLRPYFDLLPVTSFRLTVSPDVPDHIREGCMSELIKLSKTNEFLASEKELIEQKAKEQQQAGTSRMLCVYSEQMPIEGLLTSLDVSQRDSVLCIGYLATQEVASDEQMNLRLFETDQVAWYRWYLSLNVNALYCGRDFVATFERFGLVLSSVLGAVGHTLVVVQEEYQTGQILTQFENRATDSRWVVRTVSDEQSLIWGRWLGFHNSRLGSLRALQYEYDPHLVVDAFRKGTFDELKVNKTPRFIQPESNESEPLQILMCEDLYLRRLTSLLPQAYFIKGLLDKHLGATLSPVAAVDIWLSVMRRLIVGSTESTDYDVIVLVRRLELIADAAKTLAFIEFLQDLEGKAKLVICGHPDWKKLFPEHYVEGYSPQEWKKACGAFPQATYLNTAAVFHPCLSDRALFAVETGQTPAFFSSFHQLCDLLEIKVEKNHATEWLAQHNIINADACCVHAMSAVSHRETMLEKRRSIFEMLQNHNEAKSEQFIQQQWNAENTALENDIDQKIDEWSQAQEQFYNQYPDIFQESLMVLNPTVEIGITDDLRANAPEYLKAVLQAVESKQQKRA